MKRAFMLSARKGYGKFSRTSQLPRGVRVRNAMVCFGWRWILTELSVGGRNQSIVGGWCPHSYFPHDYARGSAEEGYYFVIVDAYTEVMHCVGYRNTISWTLMLECDPPYHVLIYFLSSLVVGIDWKCGWTHFEENALCIASSDLSVLLVSRRHRSRFSWHHPFPDITFSKRRGVLKSCKMSFGSCGWFLKFYRKRWAGPQWTCEGKQPKESFQRRQRLDIPPQN
jgi:hypothetical protein